MKIRPSGIGVAILALGWAGSALAAAHRNDKVYQAAVAGHASALTKSMTNWNPDIPVR